VFVVALADIVAVQAGGPGASVIGRDLPLLSITPFALLLLAIAIMPLVAEDWWQHNRHKALVTAIISLPVAAYLVVVWGQEGGLLLEEKAMEYLSFIILLAALYVISGGIYLQGSLSGTPVMNTGLMALGAVFANLIGTTGASVLLIRPLIRANRLRRRKAHIVVFFIFVVANCAGLLTPLGDPPLFMGFLKGVPFEWTLRLWPQWLLVNALLLVIFNVWDQIELDREEKERAGSQLEAVMEHEPFRIHGWHNAFFLIGIIATVLAAGRGVGFGGREWPYGLQEGLMVLLAVLAYVTTAGYARTKNEFTFGPIIEVAVLFAGIFVTMAPALVILNAWGQGLREVLGLAFGMSQPWHFYWGTGMLSSFLDNTPTYLTLSAVAAGLEHVPAGGRFLSVFLAQGPSAARMLTAITCGAVMMGANTYIGNGPNFMLKAIAEESGIRMPSFFHYMIYSAAVLIPVFVALTFVFFRG
jgi:Na+/H+ antiporter NhaD/arsenite permease-like protein